MHHANLRIEVPVQDVDEQVDEDETHSYHDQRREHHRVIPRVTLINLWRESSETNGGFLKLDGASLKPLINLSHCSATPTQIDQDSRHLSLKITSNQPGRGIASACARLAVAITRPAASVSAAFDEELPISTPRSRSGTSAIVAARLASMTDVPETLKVGVIGAGFIGPIHVEAVRRTFLAEVVALAGSNQEAAERKASQYGVPRAYGDYRV